MFYINNKPLYDKPGSCGTCPFFFSGGTPMSPTDKGVCTLFDENHRSWRYPPPRCAKLFNKAAKFPDGARLVIVNS